MQLRNIWKEIKILNAPVSEKVSNIECMLCLWSSNVEEMV